MRYLVTVSYDGSEYNGFQKQKGVRSIQEELEKAVTYINDHEKTKITGSGRTDRGVHALGQTFHVDINVKITKEKLKRAINSLIPNSIHVIDCKMVDNEFHARYMVKRKTYKYYLNMGEYNPIERNYCYQYNKQLDVGKMRDAIKYFIGEHDFSSFTTLEEDDDPVRTIYEAKIDNIDDKLVFTFIGNGFMRYQVRNMVGYLIRIGELKKKVDELPEVLKTKKSNLGSITAKSAGLYLVKVEYDIDK